MNRFSPKFIFLHPVGVRKHKWTLGIFWEHIPITAFSILIVNRTTSALCYWVKVIQSCPTLCDPVDYTVHGILQARLLEWVAFPFSKGYLPNPGIKPRSSALQEDSLPAEPQGKPENTGVGSLSPLQQIFPTQE